MYKHPLAEYFEQLYKPDHSLLGHFPEAGLLMVPADPTISEHQPSFTEVREAVKKLMSGVAATVCNISTVMLKTEGEAMIHEMNAVVYALCQSDIIPSQFYTGLVVLILKGTEKTATITTALHCSYYRVKCSLICCSCEFDLSC